jgi:hypothetical protein
MKESVRLLAGPARTGDGGGVLLDLAAWDGTLLLDEDHISGPLAHVRTVGRDPSSRRPCGGSSELPGLLPDSERLAAVQQIAAVMKPPFAQIRDYDAADPSDLKMAALAGVAADRRGYQEVRILAEHWSSRQDLHKTLEFGLGGTTPIQNPERLGTEQFGTRRPSSQSVRQQSPERGTD